MKKLLKISLVLFATTLFSQDFAGRVEYQTIRNEKNRIVRTKTEESEKENAKDGLTKEDLLEIKETFKKAYQKKYVLTFNKNESLFEYQQELEKPRNIDDDFSLSVTISGAGNKYLNTKEKISLAEEELYSDVFTIKDSLQKTDWTLIDESKKIGDYNCLKASYIIPIPKIRQKEYDNYLEKINKGQKPLFEIRKPEPTTVIAWYTPEIPVSFGPTNTCGLPGLILQLEEFNLIYLCTKVEIKTNETRKIKIPRNGKLVSKKEFEKLQEKMQKRADENGGVIFSETKN